MENNPSEYMQFSKEICKIRKINLNDFFRGRLVPPYNGIFHTDVIDLPEQLYFWDCHFGPHE